jgi:transcriptional regulator with XRE-family HTH domain/DNA-binding transcriptional regulator YdaS (Cro superfamily)
MSYDKQKHSTIIELFKQGNSPAEIARAYGVSRQRITQILKVRGVPSSEGGRAIKSACNRAARAAKRAADHLQKFGCTAEELKTTLRHSGTQSPYRCYRQQLGHAQRRGVAFKLTFWAWWGIWSDSGKWEDRGRGDSNFCMCRIGDQGAYEAGNVYIASVIHNSTLGRTLAHEQAKPRTNIYQIIKAAGGRKLVAEKLGLPPRYISQLANGGYLPASWVANGRAKVLSEMTVGAYSVDEVESHTSVEHLKPLKAAPIDNEEAA